MQIKYRITLSYTIIVMVILLLFCTAIYFFSKQNRQEQFRARLVNKAISTIDMLRTKEFNLEFIKRFNKSSPSSLFQKAIYIYEYDGKEIFSYRDDDARPIDVTGGILSVVRLDRKFYFKDDGKDVVAFLHKDIPGNHSYIAVAAAYDSDTEAWLATLRLILLVCFLFSILIVTFSGYVFSFGLVGSITRLKDKINRISSEDFSKRLETGKGKDEFQKLAITVNNLLDRLQSSFETQRRFIGNASHELSTPLASIYSQLDVALQKDRNTVEYRKILVSVREDVKRINLLLRSLLEIAKASGSQAGIDLSTVRIDELLIRLHADMKKIDTDNEVKIEFDDFPEDEAALATYGNEPLLYIAFKNIVHNACKYAKDKTAIVSLKFTEQNIIVKIKDNGPGIEKEDLKHIFQPFYREGKYNNVAAGGDTVPGAGLGLALVHHIFSLHHGKIEVSSQIGKGTTFTVSLPI